MPTNLDYRTTLNLKKHGRYTDSLTKGLQLLYKPSETKYWLLRFAFNGKRHELGIGPFPEIMPKEARQIAQEARTLLAKGENPLNIELNKSSKSLNKLFGLFLFIVFNFIENNS
jgi:hypothetical protein